MTKKLTTAEFIAKARKVHGEKYDYSKTEYINKRTKVTIICPKHGEFEQLAGNHLGGYGCSECGKEKSQTAPKKTIGEFIENARLIHKDKYDYSKVTYVNTHTKICIICPEHGEFWQTPNNHLHGCGCPECSKLLTRKIRNYPVETFLEKAKKKHGGKYDYSKVEYKNNHTKVCIICPEHGEFWQNPNAHLHGQGCPKCGRFKAKTKLIHTIGEFIKKAQQIHGDKYDYSKVDILNRDEKGRVCIICPEHGEFWQTPNNHLCGCGCVKCSKYRNTVYTLDEFITKAKERHENKYDYSKVDYKNNHTKVCIICPEHGEFWQTPNSHLQGKGCPKCGDKQGSQLRLMPLADFIKRSNQTHNNKYDYSKVEYVNSHTKVCITCPEHGEFWQKPYEHLQGSGCPTCVHQQSKPELEIIEFLKQYLKPEQIIERDRELLDGKEVDILLPDFHVGIEFNGLYWHSLRTKPDIQYHKKKTLLANHKGYRLIQIFEDEWIEHREIVLNKLRHVINADVEQCTIGARKTIVRQINGEIAKVFLEQYHIQGYVGSTVYLGAYYNDELVGVMSFKEEQPKMWNLTRFTTKPDYKLPGLASKMFKYFRVNFEFDEVKSFLDLRWNQGLNGNTVYDKLGFKLENTVNPDYRYIVGNQRLHKFGFRKNALHKKYGLPLTMTERQMCDKLGFERIYDCGLAKYVYKNSNSHG